MKRHSCIKPFRNAPDCPEPPLPSLLNHPGNSYPLPSPLPSLSALPGVFILRTEPHSFYQSWSDGQGASEAPKMLLALGMWWRKNSVICGHPPGSSWCCDDGWHGGTAVTEVRGSCSASLRSVLQLPFLGLYLGLAA